MKRLLLTGIFSMFAVSAVFADECADGAAAKSNEAGATASTGSDEEKANFYKDDSSSSASGD